MARVSTSSRVERGAAAHLRDATLCGPDQAFWTHTTMGKDLGDTQEMEKANRRQHTPTLFMQSWNLNNLELRGSETRPWREGGL